MAYKTIHTTLGLQLLAQAESQGTQIRLTHMAIGVLRSNSNNIYSIASPGEAIEYFMSSNIM